jgi:hypothetical protein
MYPWFVSARFRRIRKMVSFRLPGGFQQLPPAPPVREFWTAKSEGGLEPKGWFSTRGKTGQGVKIACLARLVALR